MGQPMDSRARQQFAARTISSGIPNLIHDHVHFIAAIYGCCFIGKPSGKEAAITPRPLSQSGQGAGESRKLEAEKPDMAK